MVALQGPSSFEVLLNELCTHALKETKKSRMGAGMVIALYICLSTLLSCF